MGHSRVLSLNGGFVLIQDGGDRSRKDLWVHFVTLERTQVFTVFVESVLLLFKSSINFKKANALILRCR